MNRSSCACRTPAQRVALRPLVVPRPRMREALREPTRLVRAQRVTREDVAPHRHRHVKPVVLTGGAGTKCRPFLTVHKDTERFAACNALADKIGPLNEPKKAFKLIEEAIGDEVNEVFGLVTLDLHLRMKSVAETGRGEPTSVMAPIGPTLQAAFADGAHAVILFHVHPSGIEAQPSDADIETTDAFADTFEAFYAAGVEMYLLDHIIVGGDGRRRSYFSFLEDGLIE